MLLKTLTLSIVIHAGLLFLLTFTGGAGQEDGDNEDDNMVTIEIIPKHSEESLDLKLDGVGTSKIELKTVKTEKVPCSQYYVGIGMITDFSPQCTVASVPSGYAAAKGDLRVGDKILSPECDLIRGAEGTQVEVVINRNGEILKKTFIRERICEK